MRLRLPLLIGVLLIISACATYGTKMNRTQVDQIQKGVTTRAQVETMLGPPSHVTMMPDGQRMLMYMYNDTQMKATSFIPYAGAFMGGSTGQSQQLQIMLGKDNIVQDYEFSDVTRDTSTNPWSAHTTEQPTAEAPTQK